MHLVGFTIEIYYDARPYERQTWLLYLDLEKEIKSSLEKVSY